MSLQQLVIDKKRSIDQFEHGQLWWDGDSVTGRGNWTLHPPDVLHPRL
jgi:hypothetical protein